MDEHKEDINHQYKQNKIQGDIDVSWSKSNNRNAKTILHTHGSTAGEEWVKSKAAALNKDDTFIFAKDNDNDKISMNETFKTVYNEVFEQKGNTENLILTGHSAGGQTTLKCLAAMYKEGKVNGDPPLVVMLDGCIDKYGLTEEEIKILADNKVPIIAYYGLDGQREKYTALGKKGLNIAMIKEYDPGENHGTMSVNFFDNKKGLYDFICNNGELALGPGGYAISVWSDSEEKYTNGVNLKDISAVNNLDKIYAMMGIYTFNFKITHLQSINKTPLTNLSMNGNLFETNINQIISKIGNTAYISSNVDLSTSNSSSPTISKITNLSNEYFKTNTDLLFSISTELQEFKKISNIIYSTQKQIEKETTQLNHIKLPIEFSEHKSPFETNHLL